MAKRIGMILLLLSILLTWGCGREPQLSEYVSPVRFYYRVPDAGLDQTPVVMDYHIFDARGREDDLLWLLNTYLDGPYEDGLISPFPGSAGISSVMREGSTLRVDVSESLAYLKGIDLTLACSCITMTCLELTDAQSVVITANGQLLGGKPSVTMSRNSMLLEDMGLADAASSYLLYFSDRDNRYLIGQQLLLKEEVDSVPWYLLEKLIGGTQDGTLAQTVPQNTVIRGMEVTEGLCSLDLSRDFLDNTPITALAQRMTVLSITNTLTQLEEINAVSFYVEGVRLEHYGAVDLSQPMVFDDAALGPVRTSLSEMDCNLYLYSGAGEQLLTVPVRVRQSADKLPVEQVLPELLNYQSKNGFSSGIPGGTRLVSVSMPGKICHVTLSQELLQAGAEMERSVRAIWATVLACTDCQYVQLHIEGVDTDPDDPLFDAVARGEFWYPEDGTSAP